MQNYTSIIQTKESQDKNRIWNNLIKAYLLYWWFVLDTRKG